jgi:trimethylamine-N-oxide reductase (cytochrome c)
MFCKTIADMGVEDNPGMPVWQEPLEYLGNAKEGQLHIVSPHPWYRLHSQMDNSAKLRELYKIDGREPVRMNRQDAEARGIADGDLVEIRNERGAVIAGAVLSDDIMPGVMSLYEGAWPDLDSKGRCNSGQINWITSERPASGLTQATIANTCVASVAKCEDAERPNQAHQNPAILTDYQFAAIDESELGLDRVADIVESLYAEMEEGERIFYQRCTVCHGPRDPGAFTQLQWRGITPSMFPRAGLDDDEAALVTDFLMRNASDAAVPN